MSRTKKARKPIPIDHSEVDKYIEENNIDLGPDTNPDEYDPNDVYEEEEDDNEEQQEEESLDFNKYTKEQLKSLEKNNRRILFLKALALDVRQDIEKLAVRKCKLESKSDAEKTVSLLIHMMGETKDDVDYPEKILRYFDRQVPRNFPNKVKLNASDINELANLFKVYDEKLLNRAEVIDPDLIFGNVDSINEKTIKESKDKKKVVMSDSNSTGMPEIPIDNQGNIFSTPQGGRMSMQDYLTMYPEPDIGLMEMALKSVPNPRPNSVGAFIQAFTDLYNDWMQNPLKMVEQLKFYFGPTHGEHAFRLWKDYRDKHKKSLGYQEVPPPYGSSSSEYQPYGGFNQYQQPMQLSPEIEAERMADRRMDKMMKMLQLRMMDKAMESQTPIPTMGQGYEEIYDQNGKVIKRIISNGHSQNGASNPMESAVFQGMVNMMQEIVRGKNNEMLEIMKNQSQPNNLLTDFAKTMMGNFVNQSNPVSQIKEMLDITNMVKAQGPQQQETKSIEAIKMDIDSRIAMQELDLKKMEMQHNWRMDEKQAMEQDSNVDKWLNTLQGMGESIIKPVAIKFLEGFGKGQMPGAPLGGMFGQAQPQQQGPQQNPYGQMSEQEYAMRQQQFYEQQRRMNAEPLDPIPPMGAQRQFNPTRQQPPMQQYQQSPPQYQQQQPQPTRPITAATERDIEEELATLSPQQIQELEDKMMIDDMNREKVKNAIRAHKNARRTTRPPPQQQQQPPEQVREAQNVLFGQPADTLTEDDFGDDYDEEEEEEQSDYEVPIARGQTKVPPPNIQSPQKKFSDYAPDSTTDVTRTKRLNPQQKAMLASGQMTDREIAMLDDIPEEEEIDDYSSGGVPMPAGIRNASEDKLVEQNLKKIKPKASKKKKEETVIEKEDEKQEQKEQRDQAEDVLKDAESVLGEAEEIPSDDDIV